jgi:hypothetical protein
MLNEDKLKIILGLKVAHLRHQKSYSYQQLATLTDLSTGYLHGIEKGKKYPSRAAMLKLSEALDISYDDLVSVHASKKLQPIIDFLESDFLKMFPMKMFGISPDRLLELFSNEPDKINAFISTVLKIVRNYQMQTENLFNAALRSYQDMRDNYFEEIEAGTKRFRIENNLHQSDHITNELLEKILLEKYSIKIDRNEMGRHRQLSKIRSFFDEKNKMLFLNSGLSTEQQNFLLARELGFQFLDLKERPYETIIQKSETFEKLYNNFKASYFGAALLMDEQELTKDIRNFALQSKWNGDLFLSLLQKYNVTAEMFLQRLTNLLPRHFGLNNLFFIRLQADEQLKNYTMTKELHLSKLHKPYANELNEHYCRRWVSVSVIKQLRTYRQLDKSRAILTDVQISKYWETNLEYLCFTIAKPNTPNDKESVSVTLGILVDDNLRQQFRFLADEKVKRRLVNTTCEHCSMPDCELRAIAPFVIEKQNEQREVETMLKELSQTRLVYARD